MTRFFAFGCSFTRGLYPTWADIVAREYDHYENWAQPGAGNSFIFYSLMECHKRKQITADDVVMIMWSSIGREDRYVGREWITPGSIYNQTEYSADFVAKFADPLGYLIRDAAHIAGAKSLLDTLGCAYKFFSIVPFDVPDDNIFRMFSADKRVFDLYREEFAVIRPSVYKTVFDCDWYSRPGPKRNQRLQEEYETKRGEDWPTWQQFVEQDFTGVNQDIIAEINEKNNFKNRLLIRYDTHPTPLEYLEYLQQVAPEIQPADSTKNWVNSVTMNMYAEQSVAHLWQPPTKPARF
jgi:hypothetical protein